MRTLQGLFVLNKLIKVVRNLHHYAIPSINNGFKSIRNAGPRTWKLVPETLKELNSISSFKNEIEI